MMTSAPTRFLPHALVALVLAAFASALGGLSGHAHANVGVGAPASVTEALQGALQIAGARVEVMSWRTTGSPASASGGCTPKTASVNRPIAASGRYAVKLAGAGCEGWGWATVRVFSAGFVTTKVVRAGDSLSGAVREVEQEVRGARVPAVVTEGAKAARPLHAGQMVEAVHLDDGRPSSGAAIKVAIRSGALSVTQFGRAVPCGAGRTCAVLPSGKHVEGTMNKDTLVVEIP